MLSATFVYALAYRYRTHISSNRHKKCVVGPLIQMRSLSQKLKNVQSHCYENARSQRVITVFDAKMLLLHESPLPIKIINTFKFHTQGKFHSPPKKDKRASK